jgi:phenylalanine-4-hydroxylase
LYSKSQGNLKLIVASAVPSVFSGAADKMVFDDGLLLSVKKTKRVVYSEKDIQYHTLFALIREIREGNRSNEEISNIWLTLQKNFSEDWLASLEIAEITAHNEALSVLYQEVRKYLDLKCKTSPEHQKLIVDGLSIIDQKLVFE